LRLPLEERVDYFRASSSKIATTEFSAVEHYVEDVPEERGRGSWTS
jgi:hypothetical protein